MALNPKNMMNMAKMKGRLELFNQQHPRMLPFLHAVGGSGLQPGSVLELKVTSPDGKELVTNIRLTPDDIETFRMLHDMQ